MSKEAGICGFVVPTGHSHSFDGQEKILSRCWQESQYVYVGRYIGMWACAWTGGKKSGRLPAILSISCDDGVFYPPTHLDCSQQSNRAPPALLTSRTSSPLPPALRACVFGWLLCLTGWWPSKARCFFLRLFHLLQFATRNKERHPPHTR